MDLLNVLRNIIGKVIAVNGMKLTAYPKKLIWLSYRVGKDLERYKSIEQTKKGFFYKKYKKYLRQYDVVTLH